MWRMNISFSDGRTQEFDLPLGEIVVGRAVDCGLILEDKSVSRQHAKITVRKVGVEIEDLQSSNGVVVNNKQIADRILLQDGDEVRLGTVKLSLKLCEDEERTLLFESMEDEETSPGQMKTDISQKETPSQTDEFELEDKTRVDLPASAGPAKKPAVSGAAAGNRAESVQPVEPAQPELRTAKLMIFPDGLPKETYQLSRDVINIGRSEDNDIVIDHNSVSRFHAKIIAQGQDSFLLDLDSANGTKVNSHTISRHKLRHWDEIYFGSVLARFVGKLGNEVTNSPPAAKEKLSQRKIAYIQIAILVVLLMVLIAVLLRG